MKMKVKMKTTITTERTDPRARFRDLLAAESTKLWSLRSTYGSLALIMLCCRRLTRLRDAVRLHDRLPLMLAIHPTVHLAANRSDGGGKFDFGHWRRR